MSIASILYLSSGAIEERNALASAFGLGDACDANLRILYIAPPPPLYVDTFSASGTALAACAYAETLQTIENDERTRIAMMERDCRDFATRYDAGFCVEGKRDSGPANARASLRVRMGTPAMHVSRESRTCDLVVTGYDNSPLGDLSAVLCALFDSRRPCLFVPRHPGSVLSSTGRPKIMTVAWDGSAASASAVYAAMPLLRTAGKVYVLTALHGMELPDSPAEADLKAYLGDHGIEPRILHIPDGATSVGTSLLDKSQQLGADCLVLGAYGHGHVREMVLGGVSNHVLKHSRIPLLMAH